MVKIYLFRIIEGKQDQWQISMRFQRKSNILVFLFLVSAIFVNSALSWICFCGQTCPHLLQNKSKINITFHLRCTGNLCKSCNLEESQTLKTINSDTHFFGSNDIDAAFIQPQIIGFSFTNNFHILFQFEEFFLKVPFFPIYLQNLSFLC